MSRQYFIGLMSGTSFDGIDASLVQCNAPDAPITLCEDLHVPYPPAVQQALRQINASTPLATVLHWHNTLPTYYADVVQALIANAEIDRAQIMAIGCHGQTVWHDMQANPPISAQLGNPSHLAELTGIDVVADFRQRDLAAGGQAAPLAPLFHRVLFKAPHPRAVLNLGGIANITLLRENASATSGFDCGPANTLLDAWCRENLGKAFDEAGEWAASGKVHQALLEQLLSDPFFALKPPRSTGPELFNLNWLRPQLPPAIAAADVQATLAELSAQSIAKALRQSGSQAKDLVITGGGAHNADLIRRITAAVAPCSVNLSDALGIPADAVESIGFAWLAHAALAGIRHDLSAITGAPQPLPLGGIYPR